MVPLTSSQKQKVIDEIIKGSPTYLVKIVMDIPEIKICVFELILKRINEQCQKLCSRSKERPSLLRVRRKDHKSINTFRWVDILREMNQTAPDVLDVLVMIAASKVKEDGSQLPPLCVAIGILMNTRSKDLSLIQKLTSVMLGTGGATEKVCYKV